MDPLERRRALPRIGYGPLAISPDNQSIAMSDRQSCYLYDIATGDLRRVFAGCDEARFAVDGGRLFGKVPARSVSEAGRGRMPRHALAAWELSRGELLWSTEIVNAAASKARSRAPRPALAPGERPFAAARPGADIAQ